jgi:Flp pilus assembly protein TadG
MIPVTSRRESAMLRRCHHRSRRGATLVEAAIVLPATVLLFVGTTVVGLGVYRYNQIAYLARQGSRWASVHGPTYQSDQKVSAPTAEDVISNAVVPQMNGMSRSDLTGTLTWDLHSSPATVKFKLEYNWVPEISFSPPTFSSTPTQAIKFTSTSTQPITY